MYGAGQIKGANTGGAGSSLKRVADIAERDTYAGKARDGQLFFVVDATADPSVKTVNGQSWSFYEHNKANSSFTRLAAVNDPYYIPNVGDSALLAESFLSFNVGAPASDIKANPPTWTQMEDDKKFPTTYHNYDPPAANINVASATIEVGELFSQSVIASFDQDDAGAANRILIEINGVNVQDTTTADPLDYTYDDNNQLLADGELRQYRTIIHYDEGPVINDTSGKGLPSPGNIQAGSVNSATRTKTPRRKIFWAKNVAKPTNSAEARAGTWQWDNDNSLEINIADGDTEWWIAYPANKTIASVFFDGAFSSFITADVLATLESVKVEGGSTGAVNNVADQVAMLALPAAVGDLADRADDGVTYVLKGADPTLLTSWITHSQVYNLVYIKPATPYTAATITITFGNT